MGETIRLHAADGFQLDAYRAEPQGSPRGALVVVQEIFGVNGHIRSVCDRFADVGYVAIAPALFDRVQPGFEAGYEPDGMAKGRAIAMKLDRDKSMLDVDAARAAVASVGKVGIVGYCYGGTLAWLAATRFDGFSASASYYGGGVEEAAAETPRCPVVAHFGRKDEHIPLSVVDKIEHHPAVAAYTYDAGHGFNCDQRGSYDKPSADQALERTLGLFRAFVG